MLPPLTTVATADNVASHTPSIECVTAMSQSVLLGDLLTSDGLPLTDMHLWMVEVGLLEQSIGIMYRVLMRFGVGGA